VCGTVARARPAGYMATGAVDVAWEPDEGHDSNSDLHCSRSGLNHQNFIWTGRTFGSSTGLSEQTTCLIGNQDFKERLRYSPGRDSHLCDVHWAFGLVVHLATIEKLFCRGRPVLMQLADPFRLDGYEP